MNKHISDDIFSRRAIVEEIDYRLAKQRRNSGGRRHTQNGMTLQALAYNKRELAKVLARTIKRGQYVLEPAVRREALLEGKVRTLYRSTLTDTIVMSLAARLLNRLVNPVLSPRVFSYLKGRSSFDVLTEFQQYLGAHRAGVPDVKRRGIYILKRDISAYGDSIPTGQGSRLWALLSMAINSPTVLAAEHPFSLLLRSMIRREIVDAEGRSLGILEAGTPTGSPVQPAINNLYLSDLDDLLSRRPGGFYARYGDDFIFAHPDHREARDMSDGIDRVVAELGLFMREEKKQTIYLNGAGRQSEDWPQVSHSRFVDYLGCRVEFKGNIGLKSTKASEFLWSIRRRIERTNEILSGLSLQERAQAICPIINQALEPAHPLAQRSAQALRHVVNDRAQLKHLDYLIALDVAKTVTGQRSVKAFRKMPYRDLREKYGLVSLVYERNTRGSTR